MKSSFYNIKDSSDQPFAQTLGNDNFARYSRGKILANVPKESLYAVETRKRFPLELNHFNHAKS